MRRSQAIEQPKLFWACYHDATKTRGVCAAVLEVQPMTSSRRKGKRGELEVAALLRGLLGTAVVRNLTQARDGGHDLLGLPGWSAEVKRASTPRVPEWWRQAVAQAGEARPALFYRVDRKPWRAVIALADAVPGFEGQSRDLDWTLETTIEAFASIVREGL